MMLESLITSKTRVKLLMRLFLNPANFGHLRGLAEEFDESTNAVRVELNRLEEANMLLSESVGNKKVYKANTKHPLFPDVQNILKKVIGIDEIIEMVLQKLGGLSSVYLTGCLAEGKNCREIELILVGNAVNETYLSQLVAHATKLLNRKIITHLHTEAEFEKNAMLHHTKWVLIYKA